MEFLWNWAIHALQHRVVQISSEVSPGRRYVNGLMTTEHFAMGAIRSSIFLVRESHSVAGLHLIVQRMPNGGNKRQTGKLSDVSDYYLRNPYRFGVSSHLHSQIMKGL